MPPIGTWIAGARPRTLPAAVVPVLVGTAASVGENAHGIVWWRAAAALLAAVAIQVGTNYANDYSDGRRGTDDPGRRVGPVRLVGWGLATPRNVLLAALGAFAVAGLAGLALALAVDLRLLLVGAASLAAGWLYTGGRRPYGYAGFGEVFVFLFFGVVATVGSAYVQAEELQPLPFFVAVPVGMLATALLVTNNLRDIPGDTVICKRTLAVRVGDQRTRQLYSTLVAGAFFTTALLAIGSRRAELWLAALAAPIALPPLRRVRRGATGRDLIPVLAATGLVQLVFGVLLTIGLAVSG